MGKTRGVHETTPELRNRMVGMYEAGLGLREIAAAVNCSVSISQNYILDRIVLFIAFYCFLATDSEKMVKQV